MSASTAEAAREKWIKHWSGYFGEPPKLQDYRAGRVSFRELYDHSNSFAEDMATEGRIIDYATAFSDEQ